MILLNSDALMFKTANGEWVPCSAEAVITELVGEAAEQLEPELLHQAATAVLHYFRQELGQMHVSVAEFSSALARVLRGFGLQVVEGSDSSDVAPREELDLRQFMDKAGRGLELLFYSRLRSELDRQLAGSPEVLRLKGLRSCVKQLAGARRWSPRCQRLHDDLVHYLRSCFVSASVNRGCTLVVR